MDRRVKKKSQNGGIYMDLKEIIREHVLRYLPAKAVCRSGAVSRDWKLYTSTPFFKHNQSVSFSSISGFFLQLPGKPPSFISFDEKAYGVPDQELKFLPEPVDLKASSNGLLCCQGRTGDKPYYVCNPVNQQWKKLPKPTENHGYDPAVVLVYEPAVLNFIVEYKVVCIFSSSDIEEAYEFEIYSSLQDSWKVSPEMFFSKRKLNFSRGISFNGVAYWSTSSKKILIFDLKKGKAMETYGLFQNETSSLGMLDGQLCKSSIAGLSISVNVLNSIHANTMPMKSLHRTRTWEMKHQFQLSTASVQTCKTSNLSRVLFTWDDGIVVQTGGKFFLYDIRTRTTTLCSEAQFTSSYEVFPYVNSLVSLA